MDDKLEKIVTVLGVEIGMRGRSRFKPAPAVYDAGAQLILPLQRMLLPRILIFLFMSCFLVSGWGVNAAIAKEESNYEELPRIEAFLNALATVQASFIQTAPDGTISNGMFYLSRPGRLRWQYERPNPLVIIVKDALVTYYDASLDQISHVALDSTFTGFLTQPHIHFSGDVEVISYKKQDNQVHITLIQKSDPDMGNLTLVFTLGPMELKEMWVMDASGETTIVQFQKIAYGVPLDEKLYTIPRFKRR